MDDWFYFFFLFFFFFFLLFRGALRSQKPSLRLIIRGRADWFTSLRYILYCVDPYTTTTTTTTTATATVAAATTTTTTAAAAAVAATTTAAAAVTAAATTTTTAAAAVTAAATLSAYKHTQTPQHSSILPIHSLIYSQLSQQILDGGRQQSGGERNAVYCRFGKRKQGVAAVKNRKWEPIHQDDRPNIR